MTKEYICYDDSLFRYYDTVEVDSTSSILANLTKISEELYNNHKLIVLTKDNYLAILNLK